MRVLLVPELYRPDDATANGTLNDAVQLVEEWLDTDSNLHVYWLLAPPEECGRRTYRDLAERVEGRVAEFGKNATRDAVEQVVSESAGGVPLDDLRERVDEDSTVAENEAPTVTDLVYALGRSGTQTSGIRGRRSSRNQDSRSDNVSPPCSSDASASSGSSCS
jgi:hypothetical protein